MKPDDYPVIKPMRKIIKEFREAYNKNPRNWHILAGYDKQGRLNIYIGKRDENSIWVVLTEPHYGLGGRIDDVNITELVDERIGFGLRKIPDNLFKRMKDELLEYSRISDKTRRSLKEYMERTPPLREKEVSGKLVLQGPFTVLSPEYSIDKRIQNKFLLDAKERLRKRLEEEIIRRYRYIG
jgi:hypothetical protein